MRWHTVAKEKQKFCPTIRTVTVTPADVRRVYERDIKNKNYAATGFVPKGKLTSAPDGAKKAEIVEEKNNSGRRTNNCSDD